MLAAPWARGAFQPLQGGVVSTDQKVGPEQVLSELFYEGYEGQELLSSHVIILLVAIIQIGRFTPFWICDKTAPIALSEASQSRTYMPSSLGNASTSAPTSASFSWSKACWQSGVHSNRAPFFVRAWSGAAMPEKFGTNRR